MRRRLLLLTGAGLLTAFAASVGAQSFTPPDRIEFMCHSGPGAGNDVFARAVQGMMEKTHIGPKSIQVVNKTGGGGLVAMSYLAEKKGDTNLLAVFTSVWFVNPQIRKQATITMSELTPIARLVLEPAVLVVRADKPWKNVKDLIAAAKAHPGKLKQAGGSLTSRDATIRHLLMNATGTDWKFISMKSGGERVASLLGGHTDMYIMEPAEALEQIRAGKVKVLATLMDERLPSLPDVPTIKEQGYNIPEVPQARGFVGPPNMPAAAKAYYVSMFTKLHESNEWQSFLKENLYKDGFLTGPKLDKFVSDYTQMMRGILKEAGIKLVR